jgi:hypothetical protein
MPVKPSRATLFPGWSGVLRTIPCDGLPVSFAVEVSASDSGPGGLMASWTLPITAFTAPIPGSWRSMIRQITPAANSEIAIGMNTAVLNASDQLTFSISTANTSPIALIVAGTTATQIALFLIAVVIAGVVNSAL